MHDFSDFDDYRTSAWFREGLLIPVENVFHSIKTSAAQAGAALAIGVAASSFATFVYSTNIAGPIWHPVASQRVDARLERMQNEFSAELSRFGKDTSAEIDATTLALAERAMAALATRQLSNKA
jgi:hypothetical protein